MTVAERNRILEQSQADARAQRRPGAIRRAVDPRSQRSGGRRGGQSIGAPRAIDEAARRRDRSRERPKRRLLPLARWRARLAPRARRKHSGCRTVTLVLGARDLTSRSTCTGPTGSPHGQSGVSSILELTALVPGRSSGRLWVSAKGSCPRSKANRSLGRWTCGGRQRPYECVSTAWCAFDSIRCSSRTRTAACGGEDDFMREYGVLFYEPDQRFGLMEWPVPQGNAQ